MSGSQQAKETKLTPRFTHSPVSNALLCCLKGEKGKWRILFNSAS